MVLFILLRKKIGKKLHLMPNDEIISDFKRTQKPLQSNTSKTTLAKERLLTSGISAIQ